MTQNPINTTASKPSLSTVRKLAWATRRAKYGDKGHSGSYSANGRCGACHSMRESIIRLHIEGVLSEGQASKILKCGRIEVRRLSDEADSKLHLGATQDAQNKLVAAVGDSPAIASYFIDQSTP